MVHFTHKPAAEHLSKPAIPAAKAAPILAGPSVTTTAAQNSKGVGYSGNAVHDANVAVAENVRQNAIVAAGNNPASLRAASIAYHQSVGAVHW
jgi:hypothetical protein